MVMIFSYFFEAGAGLALGLTIGILPGSLIFRWLKTEKQPAARHGGVDKKQHKAVVTG